jgi:hypothetical protein
MPAHTTVETTTALSDLVIHEFDQWSNPAEPAFTPTSSCWCRQDPAGDTLD